MIMITLSELEFHTHKLYKKYREVSITNNIKYK